MKKIFVLVMNLYDSWDNRLQVDFPTGCVVDGRAVLSFLTHEEEEETEKDDNNPPPDANSSVVLVRRRLCCLN